MSEMNIPKKHIAEHFIIISQIDALNIKYWGGFIDDAYYIGVAFSDKQFLKIIKNEEEKINFLVFCLTELNKLNHSLEL